MKIILIIFFLKNMRKYHLFIISLVSNEIPMQMKIKSNFFRWNFVNLIKMNFSLSHLIINVNLNWKKIEFSEITVHCDYKVKLYCSNEMKFYVLRERTETYCARVLRIITSRDCKKKHKAKLTHYYFSQPSRKPATVYQDR